MANSNSASRQLERERRPGRERERCHVPERAERGDGREQGRPLLIDVRGVRDMAVARERGDDPDVLINPGVLRGAVDDRHRAVDGHDHADELEAEQPGPRLAASQLEHEAEQQDHETEDEPDVRVRE